MIGFLVGVAVGAALGAVGILLAAFWMDDEDL